MPNAKSSYRPGPSALKSYARLPWWFHLLSSPAIFLILRYSFFKVHDGMALTDLEYYAYAYAPGLLSLLPTPFLLYALLRKYRQNKWFKAQKSIYDIRRLSWQQFEVLIAAAFDRLGYSTAVVGGGGADGGKDILLKKKGKRILAQCKHWKSTSVGAPVVREMFGLMVAEKMDVVMIVTSGTFTKEAELFAKGKPIVLINGNALVKLLAGIRKRK